MNAYEHMHERRVPFHSQLCRLNVVWETFASVAAQLGAILSPTLEPRKLRHRRIKGKSHAVWLAAPALKGLNLMISQTFSDSKILGLCTLRAA